MDNFKTAAVLTFATIRDEHNRLQNFISHSKDTDIVLDLSAIQSCDSAGLALMLEAKRLATRYQKKCTFNSVPELVNNLAIFCGIETLFTN